MKKPRNRMTTLIGMAIAAFALMWGSAASGETLTPSTLFGDVDGTNTLSDIAAVVAPNYATLKQSVLSLESMEHVTTNDVRAISNEELASVDTSYFYSNGITNKNQSVQYVSTGAGVTSLSILIPEDGTTKDWIIYVEAAENLELILPQATYWCASESVTNAISAGTPTALYFSQVTDGVFSFGRMELTPITMNARGIKATVKGGTK